MQLSEIQDQVRFLTKEPFPNSPQFATNSRVTFYANEACRKIASLTKCYVSTNVPNSTGNPALSTVAGQYMYQTPSDCLEILTMKISVWTLRRKTLDWVNQQTGYMWWQYSGMPLYYFPIQETSTNFGVWMTPQAVYPISIWYIRRPNTLVNSTDTIDLDNRLNMAVVYYCCEQIMSARREMNFKAGYWMKLFYQEVQEYNNTADQSIEPSDMFGQMPITTD